MENGKLKLRFLRFGRNDKGGACKCRGASVPARCGTGEMTWGVPANAGGLRFPPEADKPARCGTGEMTRREDRNDRETIFLLTRFRY